MNPRLNHCAELQIELARLKIFAHTFTNHTPMDQTSARAGEALLDRTYLLLASASLGKTWIYPNLIAGLITALKEFPWQAVYRLNNYSDEDIEELKKAFARRAAPLRSIAEDLRDTKTSWILLELARYIRSVVGVGARSDEHLYQEVACLFVDKDVQLEVRQQLNNWSLRTQNLLSASAFELSSELISMCPSLEPAQEMLDDLLDRMTNLIYVPLVFDEGKIGVSIPVGITADFHQALAEPLFRIFGREETESPAWLQINSSFVDAVKRGRERAVRLLSKRGRNNEHREFKVTVDLPDLRIRRNSENQGVDDQILVYDQGSIEYPAALALFPQHPLLKMGIPLNPEVMATGPIEADSLESKYRASRTVGRIQHLLATSHQRLTYTDSSAVRLFRTNNDLPILENYFRLGLGHNRVWESINRRHPKILSVKDARWDQPLKAADTSRPLTPPLIPTIGRHQAALHDMLAGASAVQLQGLSGIGKTFLIAQWLLIAQEDYDLVIFVSIPDFPLGKVMAQWVGSAFENLAEQLNTWWERPQLLQRFTSRQSLIGSPSELVTALKESLSDLRVLWVIDHGESLLNKDFAVSESRFAVLIEAVNDGDCENFKLLFIANRRLTMPCQLPVYELRDGFTFEEACEYLSPKVWRFPELRQEVASVLGNHPRALALLVGHAGDYSIHPAEIRNVIQSLPDEQGEVDLREVVCNKILGHVVKHLKSDSLDVWWTLLLASVFVEDFDLRQYDRLKQLIPNNGAVSKSYEALSNLTRRSLLSESDNEWGMHSLVRGYSQAIFLREYPKQYKLAHQKAGETYFPLTKNGQLISSPPSHVKSRYSDAGGCATALYHFETAEYLKGQQAILGNYYEHLVPKAQWWLNNPVNGTNRIYGFMRAENLLRKILKVNADKNADTKYPGASEVSYDINRLMGKALYRQRNPKKYEEAAVHYREVIRKGHQEFLPFLVSLLCNASEGQSEDDQHWLEAQAMFGQLTDAVFSGKAAQFLGVGRAYEQVARRYLRLGEIVLAHAIVSEAKENNVQWDGIYLIGAEIAELEGRQSDVIDWLDRGLQLVPASPRLWNSYCFLKAQMGELDSLPEESRLYPRGIDSVLTLSHRLSENGLTSSAVQILTDALKTYPDHPTLLAQRARLAIKIGDVKEGIKYYKQLIAAAPLNPAWYLEVGQLYFSIGDPASALETYSRGCESTHDQTMYLNLGRYYEDHGDAAKGEAIYLEGLSEAGDSIDIHLALGELYEKQNRWGEAERFYNEVIRQDRSGAVYFALGRFYINRDQALKAEEILLQGVNAFPSSSCGLLLGNLYTRQDRLDEAEAVFLRALSSSSSNPDIYVSLAKLYEQRGRFDEAEAFYLTGISTMPKAFSLYSGLGELYDQYQPDKVEDIYLEGISTIPNAYSLYFKLGEFYETHDRLDDAEELYLKGKSTMPGSGNFFQKLGNLYEKRGCVDKAKEIYLEGMSAVPSFDGNSIALSRLYEKQGQPEKAKEALLEAISTIPASFTPYILLGEFYEREGAIDKAEKILLQCISAIPNSFSGNLALGRLLKNQNQLDRAEEVLRKALSTTMIRDHLEAELKEVIRLKEKQ